MLADAAVFAIVIGPIALLLASIFGLVAAIDLWSRHRKRAHAWLVVSLTCAAAVALLWTFGPSFSVV